MKKYVLILMGVLCLLLSGCQSSQLSGPEYVTKPPEVTASPAPMPAGVENNKEELRKYYMRTVVRTEAQVDFSVPGGYYAKSAVLELSSEGAFAIFYTDDGSEPSYQSIRYSHALSLSATSAELPQATVIRAVAYYTNGTKSPVFTQVYFVNTKIRGRFNIPVVSIVGAPEELASGPSALLVGQRALDTGAQAQRDVLVKVFSVEGTEILSQPATLRVYGGESRTMPVKSLRLTAQADDFSDSGVFPLSLFDTQTADGSAMQEYHELILSSGEDDFQYAFMRDEVALRMAQDMGFADVERFTPVAVYINGDYYGLHWLHEGICNQYFQTKYGEADGRYAVIEWNGNSENPAQAAEAEDQPAAAAFRQNYEQMLSLDFQEESSFEQLRRFIDVENYLDYCALNVYIDNDSWPGRMQAYAYLPSGTDALTVQWKFLPHGMDHSFGLNAEKERREALEAVLDPESERCAPLFAKLMEREDCRTYFIERMTALMEGAFQPETLVSLVTELHNARNVEMQHYLTRLEALRKTRNSVIWMKKDDFYTAIYRLKSYINKRPDTMREAIEKCLLSGGAEEPEDMPGDTAAETAEEEIIPEESTDGFAAEEPGTAAD